MLANINDTFFSQALGEAKSRKCEECCGQRLSKKKKKTRAYSFDAWVSLEVSGDEVNTSIDDMVIRYDVRER